MRDVLVADASRRTTALNAYVSGLGPTRRIVVYDTLLADAPPGEVEAVVAHELGHARDNDVLTGTALGALGAAAAVCAVFLLGSWTGLLRRAGVDSIGDPRAVGLLLALAAVAGLVGAPLQNAVSRLIEARADAHALAVTARSVHCGGHGAATGHDQPGRRRPAPVGVPHVRHPSVGGGADRGRPGLRAGRAVTTLLVTNDFPPRPGGIQQFVHNLAVRQPKGSLVVYCSNYAGAERVRRRAAVRRDPGGHLGAAADPGGGPAGGRRSRPGTTATRSGSAPPPRSACSPPG